MIRRVIALAHLHTRAINKNVYFFAKGDKPEKEKPMKGGKK